MWIHVSELDLHVYCCGDRSSLSTRKDMESSRRQTSGHVCEAFPTRYNWGQKTHPECEWHHHVGWSPGRNKNKSAEVPYLISQLSFFYSLSSYSFPTMMDSNLKLWAKKSFSLVAFVKCFVLNMRKITTSEKLMAKVGPLPWWISPCNS